jgi:hypothetical protein
LFVAVVSSCVLLLDAQTLRAEPTAPAPATSKGPELVAAIEPPDLAFKYVQPAHANWFRLSLEELGVLLAGSGYYFSEKSVNSVDWEFGYSWSTLERKLIGDGYALDDNYFNTNFLSHPGSGALYYAVARANHVGVGSALLTAFMSSALWELVGEFRERVSINDVFVTPLGGFAFGEPLIQLSSFFDRSCDTTTNRILGSFFAPPKAVNDYFDHAQLARGPYCDAHGLSSIGEHSFNLQISNQFTQSGQHEEGGMLLAARGEVVNLRHFGQEGSGYSSFSDGNLAELSLAVRTGSQGLDVARISARTIPIGVHSRQLRRVFPYGVIGSEWLSGLGVAINYDSHRYSGDVTRDPFCVLEAPAWFTRFRRFFGDKRLEVDLVVAGAFGGVGAFAQEAYVAEQGPARLTMVAQAHGYNHVVGVALGPRARWITPEAEVSVDLGAERLFGLSSPDADGATHDVVAVREARRHAEAVLSVGPSDGPRWQSSALVSSRSGSVGSASRRVIELGVTTGVSFQF